MPGLNPMAKEFKAQLSVDTRPESSEHASKPEASASEKAPAKAPIGRIQIKTADKAVGKSPGMITIKTADRTSSGKTPKEQPSAKAKASDKPCNAATDEQPSAKASDKPCDKEPAAVAKDKQSEREAGAQDGANGSCCSAVSSVSETPPLEQMDGAGSVDTNASESEPQEVLEDYRVTAVTSSGNVCHVVFSQPLPRGARILVDVCEGRTTIATVTLCIPSHAAHKPPSTSGVNSPASQSGFSSLGYASQPQSPPSQPARPPPAYQTDDHHTGPTHPPCPPMYTPPQHCSYPTYPSDLSPAAYPSYPQPPPPPQHLYDVYPSPYMTPHSPLSHAPAPYYQQHSYRYPPQPCT
ncbi:hypothetical protein DIPPA_11755 [Diplonema papillatum]|nr:hypothetical protein DIPPA_11755 [Diplonema papillatum]